MTASRNCLFWSQARPSALKIIIHVQWPTLNYSLISFDLWTPAARIFRVTLSPRLCSLHPTYSNKLSWINFILSKDRQNLMVWKMVSGVLLIIFSHFIKNTNIVYSHFHFAVGATWRMMWDGLGGSKCLFTFFSCGTELLLELFLCLSSLFSKWRHLLSSHFYWKWSG